MSVVQLACVTVCNVCGVCATRVCVVERHGGVGWLAGGVFTTMYLYGDDVHDAIFLLL